MIAKTIDFSFFTNSLAESTIRQRDDEGFS